MKKSTTELTSSQNHSLSLAAINCQKKKREGIQNDNWMLLWYKNTTSSTHRTFQLHPLLTNCIEWQKLHTTCWVMQMVGGVSSLRVYLFIHSGCQACVCTTGMLLWYDSHASGIITTVFNLKARCVSIHGWLGVSIVDHPVKMLCFKPILPSILFIATFKVFIIQYEPVKYIFVMHDRTRVMHMRQLTRRPK